MSESTHIHPVNIADFAGWLCDRQGFSIDDETGEEREHWLWESEAIITEVLRRADQQLDRANTTIIEMGKVIERLDEMPFREWPPVRRIQQVAAEMAVRFMGGATTKEIQAWAQELFDAARELDDDVENLKEKRTFRA